MADDNSQPLRGYHRLAHLMGNFSETAIFRRFSTLNMVNLLTLQAELLDLETQLHDIWSEDGERDIEKNYAVNLFAMIRSPNSMQAQMATIIRDKLKEYSQFLVWTSKIASLRSRRYHTPRSCPNCQTVLARGSRSQIPARMACK